MWTLNISALRDTMILNKLNTTNFMILFQMPFQGLFTLSAMSTDTDTGTAKNFNLATSLTIIKLFGVENGLCH